uniref:Bifunctional inhibitor/plant lipid transfer protein/seed storage helical domain-containing protein n=1 Tax=Ananas comosus var. bracteatus TaxID=296719 RepID=A0A6V7QJH1_ANACO|nr:unnamed protein product [Ananas comosus var. bracteatus]
MAHLIVSFFVAFIASSLSLSARAEAPPCNEVVQMVVPCVPYLTDRAAVPFGPCCNEVVALNRTASTRQDRITICRCLEGAAPASASPELTSRAPPPSRGCAAWCCTTSPSPQT